MLKWLMIVGAVVLVVAGVAIYQVLNSLDAIVEAAIEKYGSEITGTAVRVGSVELALREGRGTLRDVTIANPSGFSSGDAFRLGEITLDIDPGTITGSPVVIDRVTVAGPEVSYELDDKLGSNIQKILDNIERYAGSSDGGSSGASEPADNEDEILLSVVQFAFKDGRVTADATAVGGEAFEVKLPPLAMRNLGGTRGAPPGDIGSQVLEAYTEVVIETVARKQAKKQIDKLLDDKVGGEGGRAAKKLLGNLLGD